MMAASVGTTILRFENLVGWARLYGGLVYATVRIRLYGGRVWLTQVMAAIGTTSIGSKNFVELKCEE